MAQNTSLLTLYNSLPLFQRIYLTLSIALPILTTFRIIPYTYLMLPNPLTTHFLHTLNLHLIQKLILAYHALRKIKNVHNKWIVAALIADIIAMGTEIRVLAQTNIAIVVYLWARQEPEERVSLLFGIVIPVKYLPPAECLIEFLMGGHLLPTMIGTVAAHIAHSYEHKIPRITYLEELFQDNTNQNSVTGSSTGAAHSWGKGNRLG